MTTAQLTIHNYHFLDRSACTYVYYTLPYLTEWISMMTAAPMSTMTMATGNMNTYPAWITRTETNTGAMTCPRVLARFRMPRSLPASFLFGSTSHSGPGLPRCRCHCPSQRYPRSTSCPLLSGTPRAGRCPRPGCRSLPPR